MTETTEPAPVSRRRVIAGVTVGTVAAVGLDASPALAAPADTVRLGRSNQHPDDTSTGVTGAFREALLSVDNTADTGTALHVTARRYGVHATAGTAVRADGATTGIAATGASAAVAASSDKGDAVRARTDSGYAVDARAGTGTAVRAVAAATDGHALQVVGHATFTGRTTFSSAGTITVQAGQDRAALPYFGNRRSSFALATPRAYVPGVAVAAAVIDVYADTLTIHLTQPTPVDLPVAYLILD